MGEAEGEENAEHRRNRDRIRFDLVDAGRRAVRWRFTRGPHRHTVNALGLGSESSVAASLSIEAMNFIALKMPVGADGKALS
jgi:hypothetical protein